jgi:dye decolorizing peroxidase
MKNITQPSSQMSKLSRRNFLVGASASTGVLVGATAGAVAGSKLSTDAAAAAAQTAVLKTREPFMGKHQNGVELELQTFTNFLALDLKPGTDKTSMGLWMGLLTDDISRLTQGDPVIADAQPQLALGPARLTVTVGFGPSLFSKLGLEDKRPASLKELPAFKVDDLKAEFSGGDVLLHVSADDPIVLSHAVRRLIADSTEFASVRWSQQGFSNAQGVTPKGVSQRNLMGQVDGTDNPALGSEDFANTVWIDDGPDWIRGGTLMVFRRIAMHLNTWDKLGRQAKEEVIGRKLDNGAPLGGRDEKDVPDFNAVGPGGLKVIPEFAHIRRASPQAPGQRFFRRPFNYEVGVAADGTPDVGLLWTAYQRDIEKQYLPVQRRLDQFDLLSQWTTPVGSAVFAIPAGVAQGQIIGAQLFS